MSLADFALLDIGGSGGVWLLKSWVCQIDSPGFSSAGEMGFNCSGKDIHLRPWVFKAAFFALLGHDQIISISYSAERGKGMPIADRYTKKDVEVIGREQLFRGFFSMVKLTLRHKLFSGEWSEPVVRELFERGSCVGVLLYDPRHELLALAEQFRVGALEGAGSPWLYEVVAGMVEPGEQLEEVAGRETFEEAGLTPDQLLPICDYWVSPGNTSERMYLFCALLDLSAAGGIFGLDHESEDIRLHVIPRAEAFDWLDEGRCNNAATTISLMWLRTNYQRFV